MQIDVTSVDPVKLAQEVYNLSVPRGMGFLHFREGETLTEAEARQFINADGSINMDYVGGRGCKFHAWMKDGRRFIESPWYDHTDDDLQELLTRCGVQETPKAESHGCACACPSCEAGRREVTN